MDQYNFTAAQGVGVFRLIDQSSLEAFPPVLLMKFEQYWPEAFGWSRQGTDEFLWLQPEDYRRPPQALKDPTCPGRLIPGTRFVISTMDFLVRLDDNNKVPREPQPLSSEELERIVAIMAILHPQELPEDDEY